MEDNKIELDIDFGKLTHWILKRIWLIVLAGMVGGMIMYLLTSYLLQPEYYSSATLYIQNKSSSDFTTINDLNSATYLTRDYEQMILGRDVLQEVIDKSGISTDADSLKGKISVYNPSGTRMLVVGATDAEPEAAAEIVRTLCEIAIKKIVEIMGVDSVSIVDNANIPRYPSGPNLIKNILIGVLAGIFGCICILTILFIQREKDLLKLPEDVEKHLGNITLASIPEISYLKARNGFFSEKRTLGDGWEKLNRSFYEECKRMRENVQFCGNNIQTIVVTSCTAGEGKSTVSLELAKSLAGLNKVVLYIEADMRLGRLESRYNLENNLGGLSEYLLGEADAEEVIIETEMEGLDVVVSGRSPDNPTELLSSERFADLVSFAREYYDYVIVDAPPLGVVIDAAVIGKFCDGAVMIVRSGNINYYDAIDVKKQLERSNCRLLGVVLNMVHKKRKGYGRKGGYSKYYGSYYGKEK